MSEISNVLLNKYGLFTTKEIKTISLLSLVEDGFSQKHPNFKKQIERTCFSRMLVSNSNIYISNLPLLVSSLGLSSDWLLIHPGLSTKLNFSYSEKENNFNLSYSIYLIKRFTQEPLLEEILDQMVPSYPLAKMFTLDKKTEQEKALEELSNFFKKLNSEMMNTSLDSFVSDLFNANLSEHERICHQIKSLY